MTRNTFGWWLLAAMSLMVIASVGCNPAGGEDEVEDEPDIEDQLLAVEQSVRTRAQAAGVEPDEEVVVRNPQKKRGGGEKVFTLDFIRFVVRYSTNPAEDSDRDGLRDVDETGDNPEGNSTGTDPLNPDTDGDGLEDGVEVLCTQTNPLLHDTDGDGICDIDEADPNSPNSYLDTDGDGVPDIIEVGVTNSDPNNKNTDGDALDDFAEFFAFLNPRLPDPDSDGDGWPDDLEDALGTDRNNPNSQPADIDGNGVPDTIETFFALGFSGGVSFPTFTEPLDPTTDVEELIRRWVQSEIRILGNGQLTPRQIHTERVAALIGLFAGRSPAALIEIFGRVGELLLPEQAETLASFLSRLGNTPDSARRIVFCLDAAGLLFQPEFGFAPFLVEPARVGEANSSCLQSPMSVEESRALGFLFSLLSGEFSRSVDLLDVDDDGLPSAAEINRGTNPTSADTDGDGLRDGQEVTSIGTDPTKADTDGDGLTDNQELQQFNFNSPTFETLDPLNPDTDGDGFTDGDEVNQLESDPFDPTSPGLDQGPVDQF